MIPYGRQHIDERDIQAVVEVLRSGILTQGPTIEAFEGAIREYVGARYAVAVSSGTAALHLAAIVAGVGPGRSLVTSPITFVATSNAALCTGGTALFADVDPATVNLCADSLRSTLENNEDVAVVSPVHFGGLPCDMSAIKSLADAAGAIVVEDAAHALGATYADGTRVGNCQYSAMTMFSFHPVKAIAAGEGGMITTNDERVFRRLLRLRSHGINKLDDPLELPSMAFEGDERNPWYYEMQELGYHYRITDIQCALALAQFARIDEFIARRRKLALAYDSAFAEMQNCRPAQGERERSGHHLYVLRIDFAKLGKSRRQVMTDLRSRDIITQVHYIPVPAHPLYRKLGFAPEAYPHSWSYYEEALTIPLFFDLTDEQQQYIIETVRGLIG